MSKTRWILLLVLALAVAPLPLVVTAAPAHACSCMELTAEEAWDLADAVVVGTVVERRGDPDGHDDLQYAMSVATVYKGTVTETLTFTAPADSAACGFVLSAGGEEHLLLLSENEGAFSTNVCLMLQTTPVPAGYVGADYPPEPGGAGLEPGSGAGMPWLVVWLGLGAAVLVLGGQVLRLRRPAT